MSVIFNGYSITPAPLVTISKEYSYSDSEKIGVNYQINLVIYLVSHKGSPRSKLDATLSATGWGGPASAFWISSGYPPDETIPFSQRLAAIERKQEFLRQLFSTNGGLLEIQSESGDAPMKCRCDIVGINFDEGVWVEYCRCTVTLRTNWLSVNGVTVDEDAFTNYVESASESWQIETSEDAESSIRPRTYRLSHSVSAKGKREYDSVGVLTMPPWQQARKYVHPRLGLDTAFLTSSGVLDLKASCQGFNHVRSENIGELDGTYGVTETWLLASGSALEDFTVNTAVTAEDGLVHVGIEGRIIGLELRNSAMEVLIPKSGSAEEKFISVTGLLHGRAQAFSGASLNPIPKSYNYSKNPSVGTINYQYDWDDRPTAFISGARSETITIGYNYPVQSIAVIPILGSLAGPVLQDLGTVTERIKTVNIQAVLTKQSSINYTLPNLSALVAAVTPTGTQVYLRTNTENLDNYTHYNASLEWIIR